MTNTSEVTAVAHLRINASAATVFDAWLSPERVAHWFAPGMGPLTEVRIDGRVGGGFRFVQRRGAVDAAHEGDYLVLQRPDRLVFSWRVPPDTAEPSRIEIDITGQGDACEVTVRHVLGARWAEHVDRAAASWQRMLQAMADSV